MLKTITPALYHLGWSSGSELLPVCCDTCPFLANPLVKNSDGFCNLISANIYGGYEPVCSDSDWSRQVRLEVNKIASYKVQTAIEYQKVIDAITVNKSAIAPALNLENNVCLDRFITEFVSFLEEKIKLTNL